MKRYYLFFCLILTTISACNSDDNNTLAPDIDTEHLIAYFPFNGNANNILGPNSNISIEGAMLTSDLNTNENSAFYFDGIDDIISIGHQNTYNLGDEFTISALVYPEAIKTQHIIRKGSAVNGSSSRPYSISFSATGNIGFSINTQNGQNTYSVIKEGYEINQWYLLTGVLKDSEISLYINGELEASLPVNGIPNVNSEPLLFGSRLGLETDTFKGTIDEIRIYNLGLNADQVRVLYDSL
jgi:hypothetical protein